MQKWFIPKNYVLNLIVEKRMKITDKNENSLWKKYLKNVYKLPKSTEHHLFDLISLPGA